MRDLSLRFGGKTANLNPAIINPARNNPAFFNPIKVASNTDPNSARAKSGKQARNTLIGLLNLQVRADWL